MNDNVLYRRETLLSVYDLKDVELVSPESLFLPPQADRCGHEVARILPFGTDLLDVSKEILSLTRCPTVGTLVFRNAEQTAVEQLRQGEVLRMNRKHLLTRNSFMTSSPR